MLFGVAVSLGRPKRIGIFDKVKLFCAGPLSWMRTSCPHFRSYVYPPAGDPADYMHPRSRLTLDFDSRVEHLRNRNLIHHGGRC